MKMTAKNVVRVANLHRLLVNAEITHAQYERLTRGEDVPTWATLKAHGLIIEARRESRLPEGEVFTTTPAWERVTVYYMLNV